MRVSYWNIRKEACAVEVKFVEILHDGTIESYENGKTIFRLNKENREGSVVID